MTVAIGGWVLMLVTAGVPNIPNLVTTGQVVRGFDSASECEKVRASNGWQSTHRCVPALSLVTR